MLFRLFGVYPERNEMEPKEVQEERFDKLSDRSYLSTYDLDEKPVLSEMKCSQRKSNPDASGLERKFKHKYL